MIQLTTREKCLALLVLLSILVGVTVRHYRHQTIKPVNGPQTTPVAELAAGSR